MPEELRVFLRAALYVALAAAIYWLVSDEIAGTLLLGFLLVSCVVFVVLGRALGRRPEHRASFLALDDEGGDVAPLEIEEEPVVTTSPWPLLGAMAALLVGLGLLYGPWLWIPGVGLAGAATYGWLTQTDA
jgi:hypothetical protein